MQASLPLLSGLVLLAFIISVPCGYIRNNYRRFSFMWFFLIHLPIPFIVLLRISAGFGWQVIPLTITGSIAGQIAGSRFSRRRKQHAKTR